MNAAAYGHRSRSNSPAPPYYHPSNGSYLPTTSRNHLHEPPSLLTRLRTWLMGEAQDRIAAVRDGPLADLKRRGAAAALRSGVLALVRGLFTVTTLLIVLWIWTLWWGERRVFDEALGGCGWEGWEKWPQGASPHRLIFVADPQLVDPHTYPGRPWPLSSLTVFYTDLYLSRAFSKLQGDLRPDTVFFLGDLFDGGREWAVAKYASPEKRYRKYRNQFWMKEYDRFGRIFFDQWLDGSPHSEASPRGRRLIASLPGNHDLGFGNGVQQPVRDRFQTFFGKGNRVDMIGNHSVVSVDTVSLSAMDQPDPATGSSGTDAADGDQPNYQIWKETEDFLNGVQDLKQRAATEELLALRGEVAGHLFPWKVGETEEGLHPQPTSAPLPDFPTIVLTHVPLYRPPGTPCGPLREKYPPSSDPPAEKDEPNALKVEGGYQYQNVLTQAISNDLVSKAGPNIVHVYSGDDHDYCEVRHREFSGSPPEITVKSLSWAMGVRRPGFQMASLWNPIDLQNGKPIDTMAPATIQNHMCLLPDQLGIFIHYAYLLIFSVIVLLVRAIAVTLFYPEQPSTTEPILPLSLDTTLDSREHTSGYPSSTSSASSSTHAGYASKDSRLASRGPGGLIHCATNAPPIGEVNSSMQRYREWNGNGWRDGDNDSKWKGKIRSSKPKSRRPGFRGTVDRAIETLFASVKLVAGVVLTYYFWLIWTW